MLSGTFKISFITFPAFSTRSVSFLLSAEAPVNTSREGMRQTFSNMLL